MEMREHDQHILHAAKVIANSNHVHEADMAAALVTDGFTPTTAEKLVALVPLAFGRIAIGHMFRVEFPTHVVVGHPDGVRVDLCDEPIFRRALAIAATMIHNGPRELFEPARDMSAEMVLINRALAAGQKDLNGSVFAEPIIMNLTVEEWRLPG